MVLSDDIDLIPAKHAGAGGQAGGPEFANPGSAAGLRRAEVGAVVGGAHVPNIPVAGADAVDMAVVRGADAGKQAAQLMPGAGGITKPEIAHGDESLVAAHGKGKDLRVACLGIHRGAHREDIAGTSQIDLVMPPRKEKVCFELDDLGRVPINSVCVLLRPTNRGAK
jgi:hypothetical protein